MQKKVSIIIRGNNKSHWLKIVLKKIFNQSFKNFEIIFADNKSTDETDEVLKKYKIKKKVIIENYTPGEALNKSIKKAVGQYILIISVHCIPLNNRWIQEFIQFMENNHNIIAASGKQLPLPGTSIKDKLDLNILFRDEQIIYEKDPYLNNANAIYRSNFIKKNLFNYSLTNIEDRLWAKKHTKKGFKIAYTAQSPVFHMDGIHQHKSYSIRAQNSFNLLKKIYLKDWKNCDFLKVKYHEFSIIINARRCRNIDLLTKKLSKLTKNNFFKQLKINKIIIVSNKKVKKIINGIKIINFKPTTTIGADLKLIYFKYKKFWANINYIIFFSSEAEWKYNNIKKTISICIKNSSECVHMANKIYDNFEVIFKNGSLIKSDTLQLREDKPWINLIKSADGCILIPKILKEEKLLNENVKFLYNE